MLTSRGDLKSSRRFDVSQARLWQSAPTRRCVSDGPGLGKTCNLSEARSCPMGPVHTPLPPPASESLSLGDCRESCVFIGLLVLVGVCYWRSGKGPQKCSNGSIDHAAICIPLKLLKVFL